jgi:excisionase family DNA binding protein
MPPVRGSAAPQPGQESNPWCPFRCGPESVVQRALSRNVSGPATPLKPIPGARQQGSTLLDATRTPSRRGLPQSRDQGTQGRHHPCAPGRRGAARRWRRFGDGGLRGGGRKGKGRKRCGLRPLSVAGCTGLEPVASGVTVSEMGLAGRGRSSQPLAITQGEDGRDSSVSLDSGTYSLPRVTPWLQSPIVKSVPAERLPSVREVAARLGVCASTIYNPCREGKLPHVRVSNAIRVAPTALEDLMPGGARSGVV